MFRLPSSAFLICLMIGFNPAMAQPAAQQPPAQQAPAQSSGRPRGASIGSYSRSEHARLCQSERVG